MAHWKSMMERKLFDAGDLDGRDRTVQIVAVKAGEVEGKLGGKFSKTKRPLVTIAGFDRPFALNATNAKVITTVLGTPDTARWAGQWITLYATIVEAPEGMVEAVRVRPVKPSQPAGVASTPPKDGPPLTDEQQAQVVAICEAIDAAPTEEAIDAAINPHRPAVKTMGRRAIATVTAAKNARAAALKAAS